MKKILFISIAAVVLSACSKVDNLYEAAVDKIPQKMDNLSSSTTELKRLETVKTAIAELNDPKNYKKLSPIPVDLLPYAKKAAENMLVDEELVPYVYTKIKDIETIRYDDNNMGKPYDMNNPESVEFEMNKVGVFNALAAMSAFLPEEKIDRLLARLESSEEYSATAIQILAMRAYFINNVLMNEKYKQDKLVDVGSVEAAISYNKSVEKILRLPYAQDIKMTVTGFVLLTDFNQALSIQLDPDSAKKNWQNIHEGIKYYLKVGQFSNDGSSKSQQQTRANAALAAVEQALTAWGVIQP